VKILWEEDCDDCKKSDIDKNTLNRRYRFSCVFEVIAWFIEYFQFLEEDKSDDGDDNCYDGCEEVIHGLSVGILVENSKAFFLLRRQVSF